MKTISLCMIVKNEEAIIKRCLSSVTGLFDEIIIIDTGSTDKTKEIVAEFTDKIYDFKWIFDFSAARNFSFSKATCDYIMWLDADDVVPEAELKKMIELKATLDNTVDIYRLKYNTRFDALGNPTFYFFRERIVKRSRNFLWVDPIHEFIDARGKTVDLDISIDHKQSEVRHSTRNLEIFQKMIAKKKELSPRNLFYYARELSDHKMNDQAIIFFNKFLDTRKGWIEDCINACFILSNIYLQEGKLYEMQQIILRSFTYDLPRSNMCCQYGLYFYTQQQYEKAVFWYDLATKLDETRNKGFYDSLYSNIIPYLQLTVCLDRLGYLPLAYDFHLLAKEVDANHPSVVSNNKYFESKKSLLGEKYRP